MDEVDKLHSLDRHFKKEGERGTNIEYVWQRNNAAVVGYKTE